MSPQPAAAAVVIDLIQLLGAVAGLVVFFLGIVFAFGKLLIREFNLRLNEKFASRDQSLAEIREHISKIEAQGDSVEKDLLRFRAELPDQYVRREDWIRFSGTIDTKLDWLREKCQATAVAVAQLLARQKVGGDDDGG